MFLCGELVRGKNVDGHCCLGFISVTVCSNEFVKLDIAHPCRVRGGEKRYWIFQIANSFPLSAATRCFYWLLSLFGGEGGGPYFLWQNLFKFLFSVTSIITLLKRNSQIAVLDVLVAHRDVRWLIEECNTQKGARSKRDLVHIHDATRYMFFMPSKFENIQAITTFPLMAHSHCTGLGTGTGFVHYTVYNTHYTGTGKHCFLLCSPGPGPSPGPLQCVWAIIQ